jgi:WD40 repeat protein
MKRLAAALRHNARIWTFTHDRVLNGVAFSPDGARVLFAAGGRARILDVGGARVVLEMAPTGSVEHINNAVYSPDSKHVLLWGNVAGGFATSVVEVRDANTGRVIADLNGHVDAVLSVTLDRTGRFVLTTSGF